MKTLFANADILTEENGAFTTIHKGYLGIENDRIIYIGAAKPEEKYDELRDFSGKLLIPGLINGHTHSPMTVLRGHGSDQNLQSWLFDYIFPAEDKLRSQDIRVGTDLAILEMLATGTTSFTDMYNFTADIAECVLASGIRANLGRPVQEFADGKPEDNFRVKESLELFKAYHHSGDDRLRIDFSIHAEYTSTEALVRYYSELCAENHGLMHLHMSETRTEHEECIARHGKTPAAYFRDCGTFLSPTAAAHSVWVSEEDMDIMAQYGVTAMHNPSSNMKLGSGFAPIEKMRAKGINVTLGTDGAASNNNLNMFEELHLASIIHNGYMQDPTVMKPDYTFAMATRNGAIQQGRDDIGSLTVGKKADIVAIDLRKPHLVPNLETLATLCYSAQGSDVCMTMVNGRVLYENGEFKTIDAERTYALASESVAYLGI